MALDKVTGTLIWKTKVPDGADGGERGGAGRGRGRGAGRGAVRLEAQAAPASPGVQPVTVIPAGSRWKYLDTGVSPGPNWTALDFNDDAWSEGPAQLGYGDGDSTSGLAKSSGTSDAVSAERGKAP